MRSIAYRLDRLADSLLPKGRRHCPGRLRASIRGVTKGIMGRGFLRKAERGYGSG